MIYKDLMVGPFAKNKETIERTAEGFYYSFLVDEVIKNEEVLEKEKAEALADGDFLLFRQKQQEIKESQSLFETALGVIELFGDEISS